MDVQLIHAAFARAIADVVDAADDLASNRRSIDRRISSFLGVAWRGDAAESFVAPWGEWVRGAVEAERGLAALADLLTATQRDLRSEDEESQRALDAVAARIIERLG